MHAALSPTNSRLWVFRFLTRGSGDCVETPPLQLGDPISVSAWVFLHSAGESLAVNGGPQGSEQVVNCHGAMSLVLEAFPQENVWRARTFNGDDGDNKVTGAAITPNRWTSLVMVYDPAQGPLNQLTLYVDGVPFVGTGISSQHPETGPRVWASRFTGRNSTCTIGCHPGHGGQAFFDGLIDEVRIFNRALSPDEVLVNEATHAWCMRAGRSQNYHYTSFEEPLMPPCACPADPGLVGGCPNPVGQSGCSNTYPQTLAADLQAGTIEGALSTETATACREVIGPDGQPLTLPTTVTARSVCEITSARSVIGGSWGRDNAGTYQTDYVSGARGNAELGFRTFYQSCGETMLSGVPCPADQHQGNSANLGVISIYNAGPSNAGSNPPDYNAWGGARSSGTFGGGSHKLPHGTQAYMMENTDGFVWVQIDTVDLRAMTNPIVSIWVLVESTGYEETDAIRVWVDTQTCGTLEIVGGMLDDEAHPIGADGNQVVELSWTRHELSLAGCGTATVNFGVQCDNGHEEIWFDMVEIRDV